MSKDLFKGPSKRDLKDREKSRATCKHKWSSPSIIERRSYKNLKTSLRLQYHCDLCGLVNEREEYIEGIAMEKDLIELAAILNKTQRGYSISIIP